MSTKTLLREQIEDGLTEIGKLKVGSDEYKSACDGVSKLITQLNDMEKMTNEEAESQRKLDIEEAMRESEIEVDRKDRLIKNGLTALSLISGSVLLVWGTLINWKYESKGYIPSTNIGRMFTNGFSSLLKHK